MDATDLRENSCRRFPAYHALFRLSPVARESRAAKG